jgi:Fe-S-cluster containining protein
MSEDVKSIFGNAPVDPAPLNEASRFRFDCRKDLACFTRCCSGVEILLSPLDILRLKKRLGLSSERFLARHTVTAVHGGSGLPVVALKMTEDGQRSCPFLRPEGCSIYTDRPAICRTYPIGVAARKIGPRADSQGGERFYFVVREEHCLGHGEEREWTVGEWLANQGVDTIDEFNRDWLAVLLQRSVPGAPELDARQVALFSLACYDADRFRRFVFESRFLEQFEVEPATVQEMRGNDEALVRFGMRYALHFLLIEETVKLRPGASDAGQQKRQGEAP